MPNWHCMLKRSLTPVLGYVNNLLGDIGSYTGTGKATPVEHFQRNGSRFGSPKVYCLPPPWSFSSITTESPWMFTYGGCWLAEGGGWSRTNCEPFCLHWIDSFGMVIGCGTLICIWLICLNWLFDKRRCIWLICLNWLFDQWRWYAFNWWDRSDWYPYASPALQYITEALDRR